MEKTCPLYYEMIKDHPARNLKPPGGHRHFAVAVVGNKKYLGWNNYKTRPQLQRMLKDGTFSALYHAETHALYKVPKNKRSQAKIYVCRVTKGGKFTYSKPCPHCIKTLLTEGISAKQIWYTNHDGEWICLETQL